MTITITEDSLTRKNDPIRNLIVIALKLRKHQKHWEETYNGKGAKKLWEAKMDEWLKENLCK